MYGIIGSAVVPGSSTKDRVALNMILAAERSGALKPVSKGLQPTASTAVDSKELRPPKSAVRGCL
jgi:hypothetical protein